MAGTAALAVDALGLAEAVVERVLLGAPVEAGEALGHLGVSVLLVERLDGVGDVRRDKAVGLGGARRVHEPLGQPHPALAVHRGEVHLARVRGGKGQVPRLHELHRVEVDDGDEQPTVLDRLVGDVDGLLDGRAPRASERRLDDPRTLQHHLAVLLRVQRGLEVVARPGGEHHPVAVDDLLVDVGRGTRPGIRRSGVALLVSAHAHHAGAPASHVMGREHQINERRLDLVVVVAPDDPLLVGVHGAPPMT